MKSRKGFTLIELIAVIIILGVLLIIAIPTITSYIKGARDTSYVSHEKSLVEATRSYMIDCIKNNEKDCTVPHDDETINVYLDNLIEKEYIGKLQDPKKQESFCSPDKTFVKVTKSGSSDYEYEACLFCSDYKTPKEICKNFTGDSDNPICGEASGVSSAWSKEPRTVSIGCTDRTSGCTQDRFYKTFDTSTNNGTITIVDRSGRTAPCTVAVRVDVTAPTCKIIENPSSKKLPKLTAVADAHSGVATYGIGTSANNPDYNKKDILAVGNGATRVYGYVKDIAGNEGTCSKTIVVAGLFNIKYDANGGTGSMAQTECFSGENCTLRSNTFTKPNAKFKYWTLKKDGTGTIIHDHETTQLTVLGDQLTLYAHWEEYEYVHTAPIVFDGTTFINTGVYLFSAENSNKDFEIRLKVNEIKTDSAEMGVLIGDIDESQSPWYGIIVRSITNGSKITFIGNSNNSSNSPSVNYVPNMEIVTKRVQNQYYYSIDGGATFNTTVNFNNFTNYFEVPATLGARIWPEGKENNFGLDRFFKGTLSNISIKYLTNERVLTFNSNGGSACDPATVTAHNNAAWGVLCTPTRDHYEFKGWNTKADGTGTTVTSATKATGNLTVYAKWQPLFFNVTLDRQGGTGGSTSVTATYTLPMPAATAPTRTGYTFGGYFKSTGGSGTQYYTASMGSARNWDITTATTLYAKWTANKYTVTLDRQSGTGGSASVTATYASAMPAATAPTRTGYTFGGYYTSTGGGGTQYYNASMGSVRAWDKTANTTLYAKWTANKYTITFDRQSGTGGSASVTATFASAMPAATAPTRTGYTFGGYYTATNGVGTQYYNASMGSVRAWDKAANTTLYAKWTANKYTVTLDRQSGSGGTASVTATFGSAMPAATAPTRTGYNFGGYYTSTGGGGTQYYNASMGSVRAWDKAANTKLYAKWTIKTMTLTYNSNGGNACNPTTKTTNWNSAWGTLCTPSRSGYYFEGWNTKADGTGSMITSSTVTTSNYTVYALWCSYPVGKSWTNTTSGSVQSFGVSCTGRYKLEAWGAAGGTACMHGTCNANYAGGNGGYATGIASLKAGQTIYFANGGKGGSARRDYCPASPGGWNGGGNSGADSNCDRPETESGGGGGGATHIASTNRGVLANYNSYRGELYIVAGGGGGGTFYGKGGSGGGASGTEGTWPGCGSPGTQTSGYAFGQGDWGIDATGGGGGGGGGFYGARTTKVDSCTGSGGSGYLGNVTNGSFAVGVNSGSGKVTITYLGR